MKELKEWSLRWIVQQCAILVAAFSGFCLFIGLLADRSWEDSMKWIVAAYLVSTVTLFYLQIMED